MEEKKFNHDYFKKVKTRKQTVVLRPAYCYTSLCADKELAKPTKFQKLKAR